MPETRKKYDRGRAALSEPASRSLIKGLLDDYLKEIEQ